MGLAGGPHPTCLLPLLQLNQNLNDVLVSLEKQHGSNTFTVKAQLRCVESPEGGAGGLREVSDGWGKASSCSPCGLGLSGLASLCSGEQAKRPFSLAVPHLKGDPGQSVAPPVQAWLPPLWEPRAVPPLLCRQGWD